jgi:hypothetical protein
MNFDGKGARLATIINVPKAQTSSSETVPIYLSPDDPPGSAPMFRLDDVSKMLAVAPDPDIERSIRYVTGASGSGKSHWTGQYIKEYNKLYPFPKKRKRGEPLVPDGDPNSRYVYIISSIDDDDSFDKLGPFVRRIKIRTPEFMNDNLSAESFINSLVVFDDTDCIIDPLLKRKINALLNSILEAGRHFNVECIYTSHLACAGNDTKRILNEAKSVTIFPKGLGGRTMKYLLMDYLGLSKDQVKEIRNLESRAVTIVKGFPMAVVTDKCAFVLPPGEI